METVLIEDIPFEINEEHLLNGLKIKPDSSIASKISALAREAVAVAKPKATYRIVPVKEVGERHVVVDGEMLESRVMAVNFKHIPAVAVYAATCGNEIDDWANRIDNALEKYCADFIMILSVASADEVLKKELMDKFPGAELSTMQPGSLPDWPVTAQENVFRLLNNGAERIGITLNESFLMRPLKSISGIFFPSSVKYENCQLCPREKCPGRRAAFDSELYESRYR